MKLANLILFSSFSDTAGIGIRQPLDLGTRTTMINTSIGPTQDVAYSDWLHASIFVTGYGDIRVSYFQQFISGFIEMQRRRKAVRLTFLYIRIPFY